MHADGALRGAWTPSYRLQGVSLREQGIVLVLKEEAPSTHRAKNAEEGLADELHRGMQ